MHHQSKEDHKSSSRQTEYEKENIYMKPKSFCGVIVFGSVLQIEGCDSSPPECYLSIVILIPCIFRSLFDESILYLVSQEFHVNSFEKIHENESHR
mmetsp:Transcript_13712/g.28741  ORF Transcript_13712/g.28741 Transcript_13712/m.28741 type:complete len:96 (+) Transcript_13712:1773-2060(+)